MSDATSQPEPARKPYFGHLPDWIYDQPAYHDLSTTEAWCLHMIAGQCRITVDEHGSMRGCRTGKRLWETCRLRHTAFFRVVGLLTRRGFVVKIAQGGGAGRANELAIPGACGCLDGLALGDDERYRRRATTIRDADGSQQETIRDADGSQQKTIRNADGNHPQCGRQPSAMRPKTIRDADPIHHHNLNADLNADHQSEKPSAMRTVVEPSALRTVPNGSEEGKKFNGHDDDAELRLAIPDSANQTKLVDALVKAGVHRPRAERQVATGYLGPAEVRRVLSRTTDARSNVGGFLGDLADAEIDQAREAERGYRTAAADERERQRADIDASIEAMSDDDLSAAIARLGLDRFSSVTKSSLRENPVWRKELVDGMLRTSELQGAVA